MSLYSRAETQAQSIKVLNTTEKASVKKYESDGTLVAHDGNTNATAGAEGNAAVAARVIFIDDAEAELAENKRGLTALVGGRILHTPMLLVKLATSAST